MENNNIRKEVRKILIATHGPVLSSALKGLKESQEIRMKFNIPVPEDIGRIKNILKKSGHKLFVVGGAVRDALQGKTPKDYDLATDALPDTIQNLLSPYYKTLETGKAFGIINVLTPSGEYEIATFRKDIGAGRRPDAVEFTTIDQDVKRRDLTINALFYDIDTGEVVDLVGGIEDLKNGVVRTVGSAVDRFGEDRLRILRAIRFAGRFGSELDPSVDEALRNDASLEGISGERIRDEFLKGITSAKSVVHFLNLLNRYKLLDWIFKGLQYSTNFIEEKDPIILIAHLLAPNAGANPMGLGGMVSIQKGLNELKYSVNEVKAITFLSMLRQLNENTAVKLKKLQQTAGVSDEQIKKFANIEHLDSKLIDAFLKFKLTVSGQEVMDQGFTGKALGDEIERREKEAFLKLL